VSGNHVRITPVVLATVLVCMLVVWSAGRGWAADIPSAGLDAIYRLLDSRQLVEAEEQVRKYLAEHPKDPAALFLRGVILTEMGSKGDALHLFQQLTESHPELPEPHNNLAVLYAEQGLFTEARQSLLRAIKTHPSYGTAHENLGDLYAKMASHAYSKALQINRGNATTEAKLGLLKRLLSPTDATQSGDSVPVNARSCRELVEQVRSELLARVTAEVREEWRNDARKQVREELLAEARRELAGQAAGMPVTAAGTDSKPVESKPVESKPVESKPVESVVAAEQEPGAAEQVERTVRQWADAWAGQQVARYLDFYSMSFQPAKPLADRSEWARKRDVLIRKPKTIRIQLEGVKVQLAGNDHATVRFVQGYSSDTYQDKGPKKLVLRRERDGWKIVQELVDG
jgi:ketosteroid isomerase-like protein